MVAAYLFVRDRDVRTRSVLRCAIVFSNAGFMGIPLEYALLGPDGVFYGVAYVVVFNLLFWSWGLVTFCGSLKDVRIRTLFLNPGSVGVVLGLPLFLCSWRLPEVVGTPLSERRHRRGRRRDDRDGHLRLQRNAQPRKRPDERKERPRHDDEAQRAREIAAEKSAVAE